MPKIIENPRERIIQSGKQILIKESYNNLNIRDVTKMCGISTGTFYNYFSNKDELVMEIFNKDWTIIKHDIDKVIEENISLKEKLQVVYIHVDTFLKKYMSAFYQISVIIRKHEGKKSNNLELICGEIEKILKFHKEKGEIKNNMTLDKLSKYITFNMVTLCKEKYLSFDEFYYILNL